MMSEPIFSVSDALAVMNQTLEMVYPSMTVIGELANFKISKEKWVYADLKDESAKMRMFGTIYQLPGPLEDGMMLEIVGEPRLHPQFGFSFQIRSMRPIGEGTIKKAADLLKLKLEKEGLFAQERKRTLPYPPHHIALITAENSAAYADFIKILNARWPYMIVDVYDTSVQGQLAVSEIVASIHAVNDSGNSAQAVVVIRGGGSADDLSAFSSEQVTRAIAASRIPTFVAIGHEVDTSLAELAADMRASTPSNAAELLCPDSKEEKRRLNDQKSFLSRVIDDEIAARSDELQNITADLEVFVTDFFNKEKEYLERCNMRLNSYHPKQVLKRGYALLRKNGELIRDASQLQSGDKVAIDLEKNTLQATVDSIHNRKEG